jgi:flagellar biosynthesis protein FlhB
MMRKDEVKRKYKESESDGQIQSKHKQIDEEMMEEDLAQHTKQMSGLATNPKHTAIMLVYDFELPVFPLPLVLAKAVGIIAKRMIEIAKKEGISITRKISLAHMSLDTAGIMKYISKELRVPVAEVLRWGKT